MRRINKLIIHCSDSAFGNADTINTWHIQRGFSMIGYHYVILNGQINPNVYLFEYDGKLETGRPIKTIGAHCLGQNSNSIGICLIGKPDKITQHCSFTGRQMATLTELCTSLAKQFNLLPKDIYGHYEFTNKICPGMDMIDYRSAFAKHWENHNG